MSTQRKKTTAKKVDVAIGEETTNLLAFGDDLSRADLERGAIEYAQALRRVRDAWKHEPTPDETTRDLRDLAGVVSSYVVAELVQRLGDDADLGRDWTAGPATEALRQIILKGLEAGEPERLPAKIRQNAIAAVLRDLEREEGEGLRDLSDAAFGERFGQALDEHGERHFEDALAIHAQHLAAVVLEQLAPADLSVDELVRILRPTEKRLTLNTAPIAGEIQKSLTRASLRPHDAIIRVRDARVRQDLKVRTSVSFDTIFAYDHQEDVLDRIQKSLLEVKKYGAALLKLHLDLTSTAYATGGQLPVFRYGFAEALERQGYTRSDARRGFDSKTMRALRERIAALQLHTVQAWTEKRGTKEYLTKTPYWIVEAYHYSKQEALDLDIVPVLTRTGETTAYTAVTIRPGLWWATTEMHRHRIEVPSNILALPTDGSGNERERMALLLATFLAVHVRRNQKHSAGRSVRVRAGTLLQEAGIVDEQTFMREHGTAAARRRDYLHDLNDQGALPLLRDLGAFDVTIRDEADFFATGRGWKERFWSAMLDVQVPDLGVVKKALTT